MAKIQITVAVLSNDLKPFIFYIVVAYNCKCTFCTKKTTRLVFSNRKKKKIYSLLLCLLFICTSSEPIRAEQSKVKTNLATHLTLKIKKHRVIVSTSELLSALVYGLVFIAPCLLFGIWNISYYRKRFYSSSNKVILTAVFPKTTRIQWLGSSGGVTAGVMSVWRTLKAKCQNN